MGTYNALLAYLRYYCACGRIAERRREIGQRSLIRPRLIGNRALITASRRKSKNQIEIFNSTRCFFVSQQQLRSPSIRKI